jgi:hypothetical protein
LIIFLAPSTVKHLNARFLFEFSLPRLWRSTSRPMQVENR